MSSSRITLARKAGQLGASSSSGATFTNVEGVMEGSGGHGGGVIMEWSDPANGFQGLLFAYPNRLTDLTASTGWSG